MGTRRGTRSGTRCRTGSRQGHRQLHPGCHPTPDAALRRGLAQNTPQPQNTPHAKPHDTGPYGTELGALRGRKHPARQNTPAPSLGIWKNGKRVFVLVFIIYFRCVPGFPEFHGFLVFEFSGEFHQNLGIPVIHQNLGNTRNHKLEIPKSMDFPEIKIWKKRANAN